VKIMITIGKRLQLEGPDNDPEIPWWKVSGGHGGDEYGNCSVYFRSRFGGLVFFWDPHFQVETELPEPGESAWIDKRYYPGDSP
jgi:hypothetical protein